MITELIIKIIAWIILWVLVRFIFDLLNKRKINYIENHWIASIFFFLVSVLIVSLFYEDLSFLIKPELNIAPFLSLLLLFISNSVAYRYIVRSFPYYKKAFELDDFYYFNKFDRKYLFSKSFELMYQQVMVVLLTIWLFDYGLSLTIIIFTFAIIFGLVGHLPLLFVNQKSIGVFFLMASILSSFVFPFLILKVEWGFVYSYICHWIFYIIAGFVFIKSAKRHIIN